MDTWTLQMGFPVVTITNVNSQIRFSQKRFLLDSTNKNPEVDPPASKFKSPYGYDTIYYYHYFLMYSDHELFIYIKYCY